jgi:hypothetical protein
VRKLVVGGCTYARKDERNGREYQFRILKAGKG